jgi:tetratricopeptide (TPR) repeat protein
MQSVMMRSVIKRARRLGLLIILLAATGLASDWDRSVALYNKGDYAAALAEFQDIVHDRPDAAGAWYYIGLCEFKLRRYDRVELPMSRALDLLEIQSPASTEIAGAWYTIGLSHYLATHYDKAIEPLKRYIELTAKSKREIDPAARATLARAYFFLERYDEALPLLGEKSKESLSKESLSKESLSKESLSKESLSNAYYLGSIYFKREDDERAIPALREAIKANPEDTAAMDLLGESLIRKARKSSSAQAWLEAAEIGERLQAIRDDQQTASLLGRAYLGARQFDKAIAPLEKVAKANTDNGQAWLYYGIALSRSGKMRKAMEALEITIQMMPDSTPALSELAYVYESDKQYQQALRIYEKAYAATNDPSMKANIERVRALASQQP